MKILGVSFGTRNGNNDTMCRVALEEAQKLGAEIEFIHMADWNINQCSGCVACSRGLVMGKGMVCPQKDDFRAFYEKMIEADGILFVDPIFESGASGLFHTVSDRMGPGHDTGMLMIADKIMRSQGKEGLNPRYFREKAVSFVAIGGSDWAVRCETDHAMLAMTPGWTVVDNDFFMWSKDVIMHDDKIERMKQIARNLVEAAQVIIDEDLYLTPEHPKKDQWKGADGACPHCHGNNFYIHPGTTKVTCELCGLEGKLTIVDDAFRFVFDPASEFHAHDVVTGKFKHGDDILANETHLMDLYKDEEFKRRKAHYTAVIAPTPAPGK